MIQSCRKTRSTKPFEFRFEDELLPLISAVARRGTLGVTPRPMLSFQKLRVGGVIPDIVLFLDTHRQVMELNKPNRNALTFFDCAVLAAILESATSESALAGRLFAQPSRIGESVRNLQRRGLAKVSENGEVEGHPNAIPNPIIISIEAKLTRWTEALEQAEQYLTFSDAAMIALPQQVIEGNLRISERCLESGIGLVSVSKAAVRLIVEPKRTTPRTTERLWLLEKITGFPSTPRSS